MSVREEVFKKWAPGWLVRLAILLVLLPSMGLFGLSTASIGEAAGYYGIEPADVQYSMIVFYAAVASFFVMEMRFFHFMVTRYYLLVSTSLQIVTSYLCFHIHQLELLLMVRFVQGMVNCASTSICISLIFNRLGTEKAREIGYSIIYAGLLCITPITTMITAPVLEAFDFNVIYKLIIFLLAPGTLLLFLILGNKRLVRRFPLYQVDAASFILYALALCLIGYVLIYGQQYYWLHDARIAAASLAALVLLVLFALRQKVRKRPYIDPGVFRFRNFRVGLLLIFLLYICRGAFGLTTSYLTGSAGLDPVHLGYLLIVNVAGIVISAGISSRMVITRMPMRLICFFGFFLLLIFHWWMRWLFVSQANTETYIIPVLVQGLGVGMLMAPLIIFTVSSVPAHLGVTASAVGVFFRFTAFCTSIALVNYFQLSREGEHVNRWQEGLSELNPMVGARLAVTRQVLESRGMTADRAATAARGLMNKSVLAQAQLRYAMDYYTMVSWMIVVILVVIVFYPSFNRTVINLRSRLQAPASF